MVLSPLCGEHLGAIFSFELPELFARQRQRWMQTDNLISRAVGDKMEDEHGCGCPCTERYTSQYHATKVALPHFIDF